MNAYTQLAEKQRYLTEHFIKAGFSVTDISRSLGVHKFLSAVKFTRRMAFAVSQSSCGCNGVIMTWPASLQAYEYAEDGKNFR